MRFGRHQHADDGGIDRAGGKHSALKALRAEYHGDQVFAHTHNLAADETLIKSLSSGA
jgi:hypothetical protein